MVAETELRLHYGGSHRHGARLDAALTRSSTLSRDEWILLHFRVATFSLRYDTTTHDLTVILVA